MIALLTKWVQLIVSEIIKMRLLEVRKMTVKKPTQENEHEQERRRALPPHQKQPPRYTAK